MEKTMTMGEFMNTTYEAFPYATVETDNEGQLIIYTDLTALRDYEDPKECSVVRMEIPF